MQTRRTLLQQSLLAATAGSFLSASSGGVPAQQTSASTHDADTDQPSSPPRGERIQQSVMAWCFQSLAMEKFIPACAKVGLAAMEGINPRYYPLMKQHGLAVSLCGSHGFSRGPVDPENHEFCIAKLREGIDLAVQWDCRHVITFTGMRKQGINDAQATANCIRCWQQVLPYAEEKDVVLVLEHLNSRDDSHPMKGHPGYFGDDVDQCVDMIRSVGSSHLKLLFDIYHVQIMNGDVIRRFRQYADVIGHMHTAGVPGRGEIDATQELNYPAIMRAVKESGYDGYVAQEFIPTWDDPIAALRHAVKTCDV